MHLTFVHAAMHCATTWPSRACDSSRTTSSNVLVLDTRWSRLWKASFHDDFADLNTETSRLFRVFTRA